MVSASFQSVEDGITRSLQAMVERGRSVSAYLNRAVFREFQEAQIQRFETQGSSEGMAWPALNEKYAKWKRKKYASYPGGGNVMMIRTGTLASGAEGRDSGYFYKAVDDTSITIGINVSALPYAKYAGNARPFMSFSDQTLIEWHQGIRDYITKGVG